MEQESALKAYSHVAMKKLTLVFLFMFLMQQTNTKESW